MPNSNTQRKPSSAKRIAFARLDSLSIMPDPAASSRGGMMIADEKLLRILHAKAPFTPAERDRMSDAEGWAWVYAHRAVARDRSGEICFTGFTAAECADLHATARATGWLKPVDTVTACLAFLCTGSKPGPAKIAKAGKVGADIIDAEAFTRLVRDGELPVGP